MHNFFRSPLFRCLICLILVCCILVNLSAIQVDAFAGGAAVTAVVGAAAAVTVVAGVMMALGVMPDSANTAAFETVVNGCTSALTSSGVFLNGLVTVLQLTDGVVTKNHVNQGIVEAILDWLFSSGTVSVDKTSALAGYTYYGNICVPTIPDAPSDKPYITLYYANKYYNVMFSSSPFTHAVHSTNTNLHYLYPDEALTYQSYRVLYNNLDAGWTLRSDETTSTTSSLRVEYPDHDLFWSNYDVYGRNSTNVTFPAGLAPSSTLVDTTIATGLIAGQIGTDIETDYETWVEDGVIAVDFGIGYVDDPNTENDDDDEDDGDTEIGPSTPKDPVTPDNPSLPSTSPSPWWKDNKWLNVGGGIIGAGLGALTNQLLTQTQNGIQTGYGDPQYKVDPSLFGNNGNGTNNWLDPDPFVPDPTTPVDPSAPTDIAGYTFDLKDIFPFCIPFDLYDFLTCLDAPPEAPVINWEIYMPGGGTYPIIIDLSVFDEVAQLLRRLELLLFCVGLAFKTRDLIKG